MIVAGRFEVEREVGAGSSGIVYRARDTVTGERVALKLLHRAHGLAAEIAALSRLSHPAVARLVAHGAAGGRPWIATEWVEGETLAARLERGPLDAEACLALARRVAGALAEAHRAGLAHGDLKPA